MNDKNFTVLEILKLTADHFAKKNISEQRLNAEILLCHVLKCSRMELYLNFEKPLNPEEINNYRELIKRRLNYEPLQYITGTANFYRSEFIVNKDVLIPRAETEILVEEFLKEISTAQEPVCIYEIGAGSGCISISIAKELEDAGKKFNIVSIDISGEAIEISNENQKKILGKDIIAFEQKNIFSVDSFNNEIEYIISNPPYISKEEFIKLEKEVKDFEPSISLTDEEDGIKFYKKIIKISKNKQSGKNRKIFFEIAFDAREKLEKILKEELITDFRFIRDYSNNDRVLIINL